MVTKMKIQSIRSVFNRFLFWVILLGLPFIWFAGGCSSRPVDEQSLSRSDGYKKAQKARLKKKIGVIPFEVRTTQGGRFTREIFQDYVLRAARSECPGQMFIQPGHPDYPPILRRLPRLESGLIDNFSLALIGRQLGLNAVIVGTLTSVSVEEREKGIWFFKGIHHEVRVDLLVEVYDTETAAKLVDVSVSHNLEVDPLDAEEFRKKDSIDLNYIEEALEYIADKIDDNICGAADGQVWKSYIVSSTKDGVVIASGERVGLQTGMIFEVFDSTDIIEGKEGRRYLLPGKKIAEIEVSEVAESRSKAMVLSGGEVKQWSVVKVKE